MTRPLQQLVDELADELGRTVTVDDDRWRMAAYSRLHGDLDDFRLDAILQRELSSAGKAWTNGLRLGSAQGPTRIAGNPGLHAEARVVVPIRNHGLLLGYMTLMDPDESLTAEQIASIQSCARVAGELMLAERHAEDEALRKSESLLRQLFATGVHDRQQAADALKADSAPSPQAVMHVLVARLTDPAEDAKELVEKVAERRRSHIRPGCLEFVRHDQLVAVTITRERAEASAVASTLLAQVQRDLSEHQWSVGYACPSTDFTTAPVLLEQAQRAALVAARIPEFGAVAGWQELGVFSVAATAMEAHWSPLDAITDRLFAHEQGAVLADTAEAYLDLAGDVKATAARLHLHRSGIYYRLQRLTDLVGLDLIHDGNHRLLLHMALKMARLSRRGGHSRPG